MPTPPDTVTKRHTVDWRPEATVSEAAGEEDILDILENYDSLVQEWKDSQRWRISTASDVVPTDSLLRQENILKNSGSNSDLGPVYSDVSTATNRPKEYDLSSHWFNTSFPNKTVEGRAATSNFGMYWCHETN